MITFESKHIFSFLSQFFCVPNVWWETSLKMIWCEASFKRYRSICVYLERQLSSSSRNKVLSALKHKNTSVFIDKLSRRVVRAEALINPAHWSKLWHRLRWVLSSLRQKEISHPLCSRTFLRTVIILCPRICSLFKRWVTSVPITCPMKQK